MRNCGESGSKLTTIAAQADVDRAMGRRHLADQIEDRDEVGQIAVGQVVADRDVMVQAEKDRKSAVDVAEAIAAMTSRVTGDAVAKTIAAFEKNATRSRPIGRAAINRPTRTWSVPRKLTERSCAAL